MLTRTRMKAGKGEAFMKRITRVLLLAFVATIALRQSGVDSSLAAPAPRMIPKFEVDPTWPKLPAKWVWGQVSSVSFDEQDNAWVLQRPRSVRDDQKDKAAPPV